MTENYNAQHLDDETMQADIGDFAYHATTRDLLSVIAEKGLVPQQQPEEHSDEKRCTDEPAIFFCPTPKLASRWGEVVLRFPWPLDAWEDRYGEKREFSDGTLMKTSHFTNRYIQPEKIEIYSGDWIELQKYAKKLNSAKQKQKELN